MKYLKWIIGIPLLLVVVAFLHYTLPGRDVVRIVGTDVKRMDIGSSSLFWAAPDAGTNKNWTRDVRFINTVWPDGEPRVYRNEDVWVAVSHDGWRIKLFTIFPNVISITQVSGPDALLIPWFNILFILVLSALALFTIRIVARFKKQRVDPIVEGIDDFVDDVGDNVGQATSEAQKRATVATGGFRRWMKRWFG